MPTAKLSGGEDADEREVKTDDQRSCDCRTASDSAVRLERLVRPGAIRYAWGTSEEQVDQPSGSDQCEHDGYCRKRTNVTHQAAIQNGLGWVRWVHVAYRISVSRVLSEELTQSVKTAERPVH